MDELAAQGEEAANKGNTKELYDIVRRISGNYRQCNKPIRDRNGTLLTTHDAQMDRWKEHFEQLLNQPEPTIRLDIPAAPTELQIETGPPTRGEIYKAIRLLNNGKAEGPDGIPAEILKADINTSADMLEILLKRIWEEEDVPLEWKEGHIVKIPKKGNLDMCNNYRGICLLATAGKVLNRIILERLRGVLDKELREEQAGFRQHRSCSDQIITLRIIIEQSIEWNSSLYVNFVDFEKAFDSIDRVSLWRILRHYGIPQKLINIIICQYKGSRCRVIHGGGLTDPFDVKTGTRQGCMLSPFLFLLVIDWVTRQSLHGYRTGIHWISGKILEDLEYADDLALLSHSVDDMQEKTQCLETAAASVGLRINKDKTKIMKMKTASSQAVTLANGPVEEVEEFTYLGSIVSTTGGTEQDVEARLGKARSTFRSMDKLWKSKIIGRTTKVRIFNSNVKAILLYASESWTVTQRTIDRSQVFVNKCLRKIMGIHWPDKITNKDLWRETGQEPVIEHLRRRKWNWIGHTLRKSDDCIAKQALQWTPQGRRSRGRPRNTWKRDLEKEMWTAGFRYSWRKMESAAQDRAGWRRVVCGLCSTGSEKA